MRSTHGLRFSILSFLGVLLAATGPVRAGAPDDVYWQANASFSGATGFVDALAVMGSDLYASGHFASVDGLPIHHFARWDGTQWHEVGGGVGTPQSGIVHVILPDPPNIYIAGCFARVGTVMVCNVAKFDGTNWDPLGGGTDRAVRALALAPNGDLYAGGEFTMAGGVTARGVARWDGSQWHALGTGIDGHVSSLAVIGSDIFVGGAFVRAGENPLANHIARWDGSAWHTMGNGTSDLVTALAARDGILYVGGLFTAAGTVPAKRIARWDGFAWSELGSGISGSGAVAVRSIRCESQGIYVGGFFDYAGGVPANYVAYWDGTSWSAMGSGTDLAVKCFARYNNRLYVGGEFFNAGAKPSRYLAEWTRSDVTPVFFDAFSAAPVDGRVELQWDVRYDEPVDGYHLYRTSETEPFERRVDPALIPVGARRYVDDTVRGGTTYHYVLAAVRPDGSEIRSPAASVTPTAPGFTLEQNSPNPFNPSTAIRFSLPSPGRVTLRVYNGQGQHVATLIDGARRDGFHTVRWDGRDGAGHSVASGVYFYRLRFGSGVQTRKMVFLK